MDHVSFAGYLLEVDVENARLGTRDRFKALQDAVKVRWSSCAPIADVHDSSPSMTWCASCAHVAQGREPVALPAMLPLSEAGVGIADGAVESRSQVPIQDRVGQALHGGICELALRTDQGL